MTGVSGYIKSTLAYRHNLCLEARGIVVTIRRVAVCELGTWQQIIFIDPDNRPRDRKLIVQIIGE